MTYDLRLFVKSTAAMSLQGLEAAVEECRLTVIDADDAGWTKLVVTSHRGHDVCIIERAGRRALSGDAAWLLEDLAARRPRSAAIWAAKYIKASRAMYGCRFLPSASAQVHMEISNSVLWAIQSLAGGGILHAEGQGFSNEDGYQITCEFPDHAKGRRQMAVLGSAGRWHTFEMDLSDQRQRAAFQAGERPAGVQLLELH